MDLGGLCRLLYMNGSREAFSYISHHHSMSASQSLKVMYDPTPFPLNTMKSSLPVAHAFPSLPHLLVPWEHFSPGFWEHPPVTVEASELLNMFCPLSGIVGGGWGWPQLEHSRIEKVQPGLYWSASWDMWPGSCTSRLEVDYQLGYSSSNSWTLPNQGWQVMSQWTQKMPQPSTCLTCMWRWLSTGVLGLWVEPV